MYKPKPLKYDYDALEPFIDAETINIHYNKHYLNYLNKLNEILTDLNYNFEYSLEELIDRIEIFPVEKRDDILFLIGGVLNHELYFDSISPNNSEISPNLLQKINEDFGSYENLKKEFIKNTNVLVGSGYTNLALNRNNKLVIINTSNQDTPLFYNIKPIMNIDLWEHAYYLKYRNRKDLYVDTFFNLINFDNMNKNYEAATKNK